MSQKEKQRKKLVKRHKPHQYNKNSSVKEEGKKHNYLEIFTEQKILIQKQPLRVICLPELNI